MGGHDARDEARKRTSTARPVPVFTATAPLPRSEENDAEARWQAVWAARAQVAARPDAPGLYLALAPMDGVPDAVYRALLTELEGGASGISVCVSEFVRVTRDPVPAAVLRREVPELGQGGRTAAGVPVFVQLLSLMHI